MRLRRAVAGCTFVMESAVAAVAAVAPLHLNSIAHALHRRLQLGFERLVLANPRLAQFARDAFSAYVGCVGKGRFCVWTIVACDNL